jgi:ethanolaminephosphotransferase
MLSVVTATFPSFEGEGPSQDCGELPSSVDELACEWRGITQTIRASGNEDLDGERWIGATIKVRQPLFPD